MPKDLDLEALKRRRGQMLDIAIIVGDPEVAAQLSQAASGGVSAMDMEEASAGDTGGPEAIAEAMDSKALYESPKENELLPESEESDEAAEERGLAPGGEDDEMTRMGQVLSGGPLGEGVGGIRGAARAFWNKKRASK